MKLRSDLRKRPPGAEVYGEAIDRVVSRLSSPGGSLPARSRPLGVRGRQSISLRGAPASLLVPLTRYLIDASYAARFEAPGRSLEVARWALGCAELVAESQELAPKTAVDLHVEALAYFGNALRITSDLATSEEALAMAVELSRWGSRGVDLNVTLLSLLASLRFSQGRPRAAARLLDREIALRRPLTSGATRGLGNALIDRGVVAASLEPIEKACVYLAEGVTRAADPERTVLALQPLAERLARDGDGRQAGRVLRVAEEIAARIGGDSHRLRLDWVRGISARAEGDLVAAARYLERVRSELVSAGSSFRVALLNLDLAAVYAAAGRASEVRRLAEEAYAIFRSEGLERRALAAFLLFYRAARAERASERLAVRVANLLARRQLSRRPRGEAG